MIINKFKKIKIAIYIKLFAIFSKITIRLMNVYMKHKSKK